MPKYIPLYDNLLVKEVQNTSLISTYGDDAFLRGTVIAKGMGRFAGYAVPTAAMGGFGGGMTQWEPIPIAEESIIHFKRSDAKPIDLEGCRYYLVSAYDVLVKEE